MFKKPKRHFRQRKDTEGSDNEGSDDEPAISVPIAKSGNKYVSATSRQSNGKASVSTNTNQQSHTVVDKTKKDSKKGIAVNVAPISFEFEGEGKIARLTHMLLVYQIMYKCMLHSHNVACY